VKKSLWKEARHETMVLPLGPFEARVFWSAFAPKDESGWVFSFGGKRSKVFSDQAEAMEAAEAVVKATVKKVAVKLGLLPEE